MKDCSELKYGFRRDIPLAFKRKADQWETGDTWWKINGVRLPKEPILRQFRKMGYPQQRQQQDRSTGRQPEKQPFWSGQEWGFTPPSHLCVFFPAKPTRLLYGPFLHWQFVILKHAGIEPVVVSQWGVLDLNVLGTFLKCERKKTQFISTTKWNKQSM